MSGNIGKAAAPLLGGLASALLPAAIAAAGPLVGSSTGTFSDITSCNATHAVCTVSPGNVLTYYTDTKSQGTSTESILTFVPVIIPSSPTGTDNIVVGEILWSVGATNVTPNFDFTPDIAFTKPAGNPDDISTISGKVTLPDDTDDLLTLGGMNSLNYVFTDGAKLNNFQYVLTGSDDGVLGANGNKTTWDVTPGSAGNPITYTLEIEADYHGAPGPRDVGISEPASLAMLGIGLAGLGAIRRRKKI